MDFARELAASLQKHAPKAGVARPLTLQRFLEQDIRHDKGPWSIDGHEPFQAILDLVDRVIAKKQSDTEISLLKAEQIGATTIGLGLAAHLPADLKKNVGYFLPTKTFAHVFGRSRLRRMIAGSQYLSGLMLDRAAVNQSMVKEFDGAFLYLLGLESMMGAISVPLDFLIYDEVDMLPAENLEWSQGRVAHSDLRVSFFFSAGYSPGAGIDSRFQAGTQHKYLVRCRSCRRRDICLEESFPDCIAKVRGRWTRVCPTCGAELDVVRDGKWVATYPQREKERRFSFRLSALAMPAMPADFIMARWEKAKKKKSELAKFRCAVLAIPDAGAMQPITDAELRQMETPGVVLRVAQEGPVYAGLDTGDLCHFYAFRRVNGRPRLAWIETIDSDHALERVSTLIGGLGVAQLIVDKKPQTVLARALAYRFPRIVSLQDFRDGSPLAVVEEEHQGHVYRCAKVDRDESLDELTSEITSAAGLQIPSEESLPAQLVETFTEMRTHLKNLRKERTIDAKGRAVDKYVKGVENHYGMAANSARLAELVAPVVMPFEYTPIETRREATRSQARSLRRSLLSG